MTIFSTLNCWNLHGIRHPFAHWTKLTSLLLPCISSILGDRGREEKGAFLIMLITRQFLQKLAHLLPSPLASSGGRSYQAASEQIPVTTILSQLYTGTQRCPVGGKIWLHQTRGYSKRKCKHCNLNILKRNNRTRRRKQPKSCVDKRESLTKKLSLNWLKQKENNCKWNLAGAI